MNGRRAVIIGLLISALTILALGYLLAPRISFSTRNPHWNGHSRLESLYRPDEVHSLKNLGTGALRPADAVLLMLGPSQDFSQAEADEVQKFVEGGGRLVLADEFGSGNDLLKEMQIDTRFAGNLLRDPVFNIKVPKMPKIFSFSNSPKVGKLSSIAFNSATVLADKGVDCEILARSSQKSHIGENKRGPFPVICRIERGGGEIFLLSDSSLFINTMLGRENNRELLANLIGGRKAYLDTSHWKESAFVKFQETLFEAYGLMDRIEVRYGLLFLLTALIFKAGWSKREKEAGGKESEVEEIMRKHPQWDRETLERLQEERNP